VKYINLGVLAHADAGKTTLVEQMLFKSGALRVPGTVEKGNTQSDRLAVERERGISVRASSVTLSHRGVTVNIIDTPGHIDFVGEAERALSALDAAVLVVSAAEGIQSQTEIFWHALAGLNIPTIIFINKIDRMGCNPEAVYISLRDEFSEKIIALNDAVKPGGRDCSVTPHIYTDDEALALCESDPALAEAYLNGDVMLTNEMLSASLAGLVKTGGAHALTSGSAALGIGVEELLDAVADYLPVNTLTPAGGIDGPAGGIGGSTGVDIYGSGKNSASTGSSAPAGSSGPAGSSASGYADYPAVGVIYKIEHDAATGKIAYVRLFTGTLRNREAVYYIRRGEFVADAHAAYPAWAVTYAGAAGVKAGGDGAGGAGIPGGGLIFNKIAQIRKIAGAKHEDSGVLYGGDSAAFLGLADSRAGDIVVSGSSVDFMRRGQGNGVLINGHTAINGYPGENDVGADNVGVDSHLAGDGPHHRAHIKVPGNAALEKRLHAIWRLRLAEPLFTVKVFAGDGMESRLLGAVREFSDEDPLLEYEWMPDERELVLKVMGKIQLEILEAQFLERYGVAVRFTPPTVIYKETPKRAGIGYEAYTMPKPCWAVVQLAVEPLRRGAGYRFESVIKAKTLPYPYQRHVELTVPQALKQGMYNWEVTDVKVTLIGGEHHHVHTHPMDFFLATPIAVMDALRDAGTELLEPLAKMRMTAPEGLAGRIIGDVTAMRGSFDNPVMHRGNVTVDALLPVSESLEYPVRFSSYTSGRGVMKTSFAGYRECPVELGAVARRRGVNPLDRMRWILYKRNAL